MPSARAEILDARVHDQLAHVVAVFRRLYRARFPTRSLHATSGEKIPKMPGGARQDADALFEQLVARFSADPAVTPPSGGTGFGASGLHARGWDALAEEARQFVGGSK